MDKYIINYNELLSFLRYQILYKWKAAIEKSPKNKDFGNYLLNETPYQPNHQFIQSICLDDEERKDPVAAGIYNQILPGDVARYQASTIYSPYKEN